MNVSYRCLLVLSVAILSAVSTRAQSNHPIIIDGSTDFADSAENLGVESGRTGYVTWDADNLYIGIAGNPIVGTNSNLYVVLDTDIMTIADPRTGTGRSDQPTGESGGATYPVSANIVYQFYGTGSDDTAVQDPASGNKYTVSGGVWSGAAIQAGIRIIRKSGSITELAIPFSDLGIAGLTSFNILFYIANNTPAGSNFAQWPMGNANGTNPILKDFYTYTRESGETPNVSTHYSYREDNTTGYTIGAEAFGSIFFVPATATTYFSGPLTTLGYHLYIGPQATFSRGSSTVPLFVYRNVTVEGTLALSSLSGGDISLGGNFSVTGTFTPNNRFVRMLGSDAQAINGASTVFDNLAINTPGGVSLNVPATVNSSLTLTMGKLSLCANTLTLAGGASIIGGADTSYVVADSAGYLKRNGVGGTNTLFPVGTTTSYNPVTINNSGTTDDFSVRLKKTFDAQPNVPSAVLSRQWTINEATSGGSIAALTFQWKDSDEHGAAFDPSSGVEIGRYDGIQWTPTSATFGGSNPRTATASGFTAFGRFAVGNTNSILPVQLASFTANSIGNNSILLDWRTISEVNNYGFFVERKRIGEVRYIEIPNSFIPGHGTTNVPQHYTYTDRLTGGGVLYYRLRQMDLDGSSHYSESVQVNMLTAVPETVPPRFVLLQNYPNPFNPSTTINFALPKDSHVSLKLYDLLGNEVQSLVDESMTAGYHHVTLDASSLAAGVYFYRMTSGQFVASKKLLFMK